MKDTTGPPESISRDCRFFRTKRISQHQMNDIIIFRKSKLNGRDTCFPTPPTVVRADTSSSRCGVISQPSFQKRLVQGVRSLTCHLRYTIPGIIPDDQENCHKKSRSRWESAPLHQPAGQYCADGSNQRPMRHHLVWERSEGGEARVTSTIRVEVRYGTRLRCYHSRANKAQLDLFWGALVAGLSSFATTS